MAVKFLDNTGLGYFWSKIKAWCNATFAAIAHTHTSYAVKHSYTTAANQAKAWLRIANANTHQTDTTKPLHVQFLLTAWNPDQPADYYEQWFVDCQIFGRNSGLRIFGASGAPFSQVRVLYENTVADIDTNDRPAIDIYLNYALATACHVEIQEVYNSGWTFLTDGVLAASTVPTGFENRAVGSQGSGVHQATYASYGTYTTLQRSNITANITLADNDTYRMRVLNCTNAITVTVPSLNSAYAWFLIKNFNATSTTNNVTIHPSTTSVKIDDSNADIVLKPGEWVIIASKAANSYSLIADSRWKSQKADKATTLAGYGITDAKIANGTITLGSNNITPLTSIPSHNQASNTINVMTGYSKPNSTSAIAASDTLNQAIGKLEKAIDDADVSNVVHKTGDETVNGIKTFSNAHAWIANGPETLSSIDIKSTVLDRNAIPNDYGFAGLIIFDKNATSVLDLDKRLAALEFGKFAAGDNITQLKTYKSNTATNDYSILAVGYDTSDIPYATAPSTSSSRSEGGDIVTRDWIPNDTRILHTTGDETSSGKKGFSRIDITSNTWLPLTFNLPSVNVRASTPIYPSSTAYTGLRVLDLSNSEIGEIYYGIGNDGIRQWTIRHHNNNGDPTTGFRVTYDPTSNMEYATCSGPTGDDDSTKLPNTHWIRNASGDFSSRRFLGHLYIKATAITAGTAPSSDHYYQFMFVDNNNVDLGGFQMSCRTTTNYLRLHVKPHNSTEGGSSWYFSASGAFTGPSTPDSPNAQQYLTYDWLPKDTRLVHTSGNEQINGAKRFTSFINLAGINFQHVDVSNDAVQYELMLYSSGNYGLWDVPNGNWVWVINHTNNVFDFNRVVRFNNGWKTNSSSTWCGFVETDYDESVAGSDGWEEFRHCDKNEVQSSKILFAAHGKQYHRILLYTKTKATSNYATVGFYNEDSGRIFWMPGADNSIELGGGGNRWKVVYAGTGSISTSDKRHKENIQRVPNEILDAWEDIDWCQFKFDDAVQEKGIEKARFHVGAVAQDVYDVFTNHNLDISKYGIYCYESWDAEAPTYNKETGELQSEGREAGDMYSLRYEEALCMEAAYQRRKNKILENRISELERQVSDMLQILQNLTSSNG